MESNTGVGFRSSSGWPGPKAADTLSEIKKSKSRAGGTAGAAVHPKTTDPTSWEVEVVLGNPLGQAGERLGPSGALFARARCSFWP